MSKFTDTAPTRWPRLPSYEVVPYIQAEQVPWPTLESDARSVGDVPVQRDISDRILYALSVLDAVIVVDPDTRGGVPVLVGTRVPVARLFAEVATGRSIDEIADDKELDVDAVRQVFSGFAAYLGRSFAR